jgi:uncharacterized DUF497 family protein
LEKYTKSDFEIPEVIVCIALIKAATISVISANKAAKKDNVKAQARPEAMHAK